MAPLSNSNQKIVSLTHSRRSFDLAEFQDSVLSKVAEWKPLFKFQMFQEEQRSVHASKMELQLSELHEELERTKEERSRALEEITELRRVGGKSMHSTDKIRLIELQAEKAKESERKMLESLVQQTKELEQTKIAFEEAKLEIGCLQDSIRKLEALAGVSRQNISNGDSLENVCSQQEMMKLRLDLRLALEAEAKSKKAMDNLAIELIEATTEVNQVKAELALRQSELKKTKEEAKPHNACLKNTEQMLLETVNGYDKMKLEYEESVATWLKKEDDLVNCLKVSQEDLTMERQENSRVNRAWRAAREENSKLREIIKQALNEATMVKEELEIAQNENSQLKRQLFEKENCLQQARQDYESIKVSEAAALDCVKELKSLFASTSATDSKKTLNFTGVGPFRSSKETTLHSTKSSMCLKIFPSERSKPDYTPVSIGRRHSIGEPGMFKGSIFSREGTHETKNVMASSRNSFSDICVPLFSEERGNLDQLDIEVLDTVNENTKKKRTIFGRLGDTLRRRSTHT